MNAPIDITGVVITTQRLILRPWRQEDLEDFYEYARVDGVGQMAGWLPHENREKTQMILDGFISGKKTFALEKDGKVIGSLGVELYLEESFPELEALRGRSIGYVLSKDYWGQGLMPEAVKALQAYLFETGDFDFLIVSHYAFNQRSRRVIEKCGFQYMKTIQLKTRYDTVEDTLVYIMKKEAWQNA